MRLVCSACCSRFMVWELLRLPSQSITSSGLLVSHLVLLPDFPQGCCRWHTGWESHSGSALAQHRSVALTTVTLAVQMEQSTQEHTIFLFGVLAPKLRLQRCVFVSLIKAKASRKAKWSLLTCVAHCSSRRRALRFIYTPHLNGISTTYYEEGTVVVFSPP